MANWSIVERKLRLLPKRMKLLRLEVKIVVSL